REAMPEQQPLPPVRSPQVRVISRYRVLLPLPGANNQLVVGLHCNNPPEFLDRVGVEVAVGCGLDVFGVRTRVEGAFSLSVHHHVTGPKTVGHALRPFSIPARPTRTRPAAHQTWHGVVVGAAERTNSRTPDARARSVLALQPEASADV